MAQYGNGSVYLRNGIPWIKFYRDGKPVYESCRGLTEAQARQKLKVKMRESDEQFLGPREKRTTIQELMEDAISDYEINGMDDSAVTGKRKWENHLSRFFAGMKAHEFGTEHQRKYRIARTKEGAAVATVNTELQFLQKAFRLGYEHEPPKVKRMPKFEYPNPHNRRTVRITLPQLQALKEAASRYSLEWRVLVEMAAWLGWRKGELLDLKVENISLFEGGDFGSVRIETSKNGEAREVPLTESLKMFLQPMVLGRRPEDRLFTFDDTQYAWSKIVLDSKIGVDLHFHDLRRVSAITKRAAGVQESVIMEMHGWKTPSMFRRYAIVGRHDKEDAFAKQAAYEQSVLGDKSVTVTPDPRVN